MKKFFWFALIILLLLTFSDKQPIKPYRDAVVEQVVMMLPASWQADNRDLLTLQQELKALGETLGQSQRDLLARIATDKTSVTQFRQRYCINREFDPVLFGEPLQKSCAIVEQYIHRLDGI